MGQLRLPGEVTVGEVKENIFSVKKKMTGRLLETKTATGLYGSCRMAEDAQIELNKTSLPMLQASDQEISTHFDVVPTLDLFSTSKFSHLLFSTHGLSE